MIEPDQPIRVEPEHPKPVESDEPNCENWCDCHPYCFPGSNTVDILKINNLLGTDRMWAPALYFDGFLQGATKKYDNDRIQQLISCYNPDDYLSDTLFEAYEALTDGDAKKGNELLEETKPEFEKAMEKCDKVLEEAAQMHSKYEAILERSDAVEYQRQNARKNKTWIMEDYDQAIAKWNKQNPREAGRLMGEIMRLTIGIDE